MKILILVMMMMIPMTWACEHSMKDVWKCASSGHRFRNNCITASDIHNALRTRSSFFSRPIILHREGPGLRKLFQDCDIDHDKCITQEEALKSPKCQRSCAWRKTWVKTFCI